MNPLEQKIISRIRTEGPLTFAAFMEMALYDPEYGYYCSHAQRIGREGDFYTSSHLHPVFGAMVAKQIIEMWRLLGRPRDFTILEMGAGEGHVCGDILAWLRCRTSGKRQAEGEEDEARQEFYESLQYMIVEKNPRQVLRQKENIRDHQGKVSWLPELADAGKITGSVFSNELLDAFPVHLVRLEEELKEIFVDHDGTAFRETLRPPSSDLLVRHFSRAGIRLEAGHTTEVNLRIRDWLYELDAALDRGFIFTIDYGYPAEEYYSEDRNRGTLMCYYRHQLSEDPFAHIGEQDITAHVDFSSLKQWGEEIGITPVGYCSQGAFLLSIGIDAEIAELAETSTDYLFELARIKKLFMPQGLGESHKVMIQAKGIDAPGLKGFSIRNQLRIL
jgi:SAM-dependent MidA family methyltransferase